jgi:hypothetical protein
LLIMARILKKTHTLLKIIAALSQESMQETLNRLVEQEYQRLQEKHV